MSLEDNNTKTSQSASMRISLVLIHMGMNAIDKLRATITKIKKIKPILTTALR
jgi:hypothetical protein